MRGDAKRREFETRLSRGPRDGRRRGRRVRRRRARHALAGARRPGRAAARRQQPRAPRACRRVVARTTTAPGCPVDSPDQCVAGRRAQTQVFADSEALDACPMLRGRAAGPVLRRVRPGLDHGPDGRRDPHDRPRSTSRPTATTVQALQTLANQAGNRLGMLRVMAETQLQASTDGLTGLVNRRSLENRMRQLRADGAEFAFVMADLDHFKDLNDTLRPRGRRPRAADLLRDAAPRAARRRPRLPLRRRGVRDRAPGRRRARRASTSPSGSARPLAATAGRGDAPTFTASFGIAHSSDADDLDDLVQRADRALFAAKAAGRDRICLDGHATPVATDAHRARLERERLKAAPGTAETLGTGFAARESADGAAEPAPGPWEAGSWLSSTTQRERRRRRAKHATSPVAGPGASSRRSSRSSASRRWAAARSSPRCSATRASSRRRSPAASPVRLVGFPLIVARRRRSR